MDGSTEDHQEPNTRNGGGNPRTVSASNSIRRPSSRPQLDLSGTAIQGNSEDENPTILSGYVSHLALDIGGSLIKLIYFSRDEKRKTTDSGLDFTDPNTWSYPIRGGRLHFVKFETSKINECLDFINSNRLHCGGIWSYPLRGMYSPHWKNPVIKATGGGAHKYSDLFKERLGVTIDKEGEMNCLVAGANFLLKAIRHEAFTHMEGKKEFVQIDSNDLYPYLLVNIGSGVSIIKVDGEGVFERVSGTCLGGGTYWGLGKLLTNLKSFDDQLELSQRGDNRTIDMLVGDIYGGNCDNKLGLPPWTIASSFAKIAAGNNDPKDYVPEDLSLSLLRMISYNIGQISYLNAKLFKIKRIFFGGYFIRGHAYTMDTISFAVHFWSKGQVQAMFLSHEGYLGAIGAFTSYEGHELNDAPYTVGDVHDLPLGDLNKKFIFFMNELSRILKTVQWEEMIGAQKKLGGCGQYSWTDPPSIKNCTQTIPGLLKTINSNVAELKETNKKVVTMEKTIQKLWIGLGASFVALLISILV